MSWVSRDSDPAVMCNGPSCHSASGCEVEIVGSPALLVVAAIAGSVRAWSVPPLRRGDDLHTRSGKRDKISLVGVFISSTSWRVSSSVVVVAWR